MGIDRIQKCVKQLAVIEEEINESVSLSAYGLDSLKRVELVILLEDEFAISFNDADLTQNNFETINNIEKLLQKYGVKDD